jgi:hypothetical protein
MLHGNRLAWNNVWIAVWRCVNMLLLSVCLSILLLFSRY